VGLIQLSLAPFHGDLWETLSPGLKPRAESSCPFGVENPLLSLKLILMGSRRIMGFFQMSLRDRSFRIPRGLMLTPMGSRWTATEVGPAKQPRRPFWRPFEPIPYTKDALRAKIVIDLIYPPGRLPIYAQPSLVSTCFS
jgi:hypothetical protein